jgi:hypothetical protein
MSLLSFRNGSHFLLIFTHPWSGRSDSVLERQGYCVVRYIGSCSNPISTTSSLYVGSRTSVSSLPHLSKRVTELLYNPMVRIQGDSRCSVNINYACFGESISSIQMITWNSLISETSYIDNIKPG